MSRKKLPWRRYWYPHGELPQLDLDGYLASPDKFSLVASNAYASSYLWDRPCLVLLGEPGMGKSTVIREAFEAERAENPDDIHAIHNLGQFTTDVGLITTVFESESILKWLRSNRHLYLFLDSLDECLLRVDTVATIIAERLSEFPLQRLSLRIVCRSAEWPIYLEKRLAELFGKEGVTAHELAPLTRDDVAHGCPRCRIGSR